MPTAAEIRTEDVVKLPNAGKRLIVSKAFTDDGKVRLGWTSGPPARMHYTTLDADRDLARIEEGPVTRYYKRLAESS